MKISLEMNIPDDVIKPGMSSHDQKKAIEAYLGREVQSVEAEFPGAWHVWVRVNGEWRVSDIQEGGGVNTLDAVRDDEFYFNNVADNVCGDQRSVTDAWFSWQNEDTVIRHHGMRHIDPMVMQVVTPDGNYASVDISNFLMNEDGDKLEELAERDFKMNASDLGAAFELIRRREGFILEEILEGDFYLDERAEFVYEISHERWTPQEWVEWGKGSACVDAKELEAWLREFRNDLQYPQTPASAP